MVLKWSPVMGFIEGQQGGPVSIPAQCAHDWDGWKEIGRTGDWFKPVIVERTCKRCGATETDEH